VVLTVTVILELGQYNSTVLLLLDCRHNNKFGRLLPSALLRVIPTTVFIHFHNNVSEINYLCRTCSTNINSIYGVNTVYRGVHATKFLHAKYALFSVFQSWWAHSG